MLKIFEEADVRVVPSGWRDFKGLHDRIEIKDLQFVYTGGVEALKGVTFDVRCGTTLALVGATGSGKTTILNLLLRLYDCPPRSIFLDGVDIREFDTSSLLSRTNANTSTNISSNFIKTFSLPFLFLSSILLNSSL
jgi:ABC-type multidrug transport system fused ATPase/permease subunit